MYKERMTVSESAAVCAQTMPYMPKMALSRNNMGMLRTSQRVTPRKRETRHLPKAWNM